MLCHGLGDQAAQRRIKISAPIPHTTKGLWPLPPPGDKGTQRQCGLVSNPKLAPKQVLLIPRPDHSLQDLPGLAVLIS